MRQPTDNLQPQSTALDLDNEALSYAWAGGEGRQQSEPVVTVQSSCEPEPEEHVKARGDMETDRRQRPTTASPRSAQ